MSRSPAAQSDGIESFLLHLAAEGVISTAQLQRAQEALRLWTPATPAGTAEGGTEEQLPLQRSPGSKAAQGSHGQHADGREEDQEQPQEVQLLPPRAQVHGKRCCLDSSQLQPMEEGEGAMHGRTALPTGAGAEGLLSLLPDALLDHLMSLLAAEPGASSIRCTCSWLRSAYDRCNTRLVLRPPEETGTPLLHLPPQTLKLLLSGPRITSLTVGEDDALSSTFLLSDANLLLQRLETLALRHLDVRHVSFLHHCTRLRRLEVREALRLDDLHSLSSCVELRHLDLRGCKALQHLGHLATCVQLQHLDLNGCELVEDLGALASCTRLQHLDLGSCAKVRDLQPLASCVELQHLSLNGCWLVEHIGPLASCVKLQLLDLTWCELLKDMRPLSSCVELQHLDLSICVEVASLAPLAACAGLLSLSAAGDGAAGIGALVACGRLHSLTICNAEVLEDLGPLAALSGLQYLEIDACNSLQDLGPLATCVELRHLMLTQCCGLQRLGPLAACVKLRHLDLSGSTSVRDLGPLTSCAELRVLNLWGCSGVEDLRPLAGCGKLQYLDLRTCDRAKDPQPLALCGGLRVLEVSAACMAAEALAPLAALPRLTILREPRPGS